jgi:hypothetical protein
LMTTPSLVPEFEYSAKPQQSRMSSGSSNPVDAILHRSGRRRYASDKQPKTQGPDDGRRWKISTNMHQMHHRQAIEKVKPGEGY